MGYLAKSLQPGQAISISVDAGADMEELARRMQTDGITISVIKFSNGRTRVGARAPAGLTPTVYLPDTGLGGLVLTRRPGAHVRITMKPDTAPASAMAELIRFGIQIELGDYSSGYVRLRFNTPSGFLALRDELCGDEALPRPPGAS